MGKGLSGISLVVLFEDYRRVGWVRRMIGVERKGKGGDFSRPLPCNSCYDRGGRGGENR